MTRLPTTDPARTPADVEPTVTATPRRRFVASRLLVLVFLLALYIPALLLGGEKVGKYWLPLLTQYAALAIFALSVDLIWGYTGLLSLGQGLFFGLGAYAIGYSLKLQKAAEEAGKPFTVPADLGDMAKPDFMAYCRLEEVPHWIAPLIHIWLAIPLALLVPLLVAAGFGMLTFRLRVKDVYFSLITQALVLAVYILIVNQQAYTGGIVGMNYLGKLELFEHRFKIVDLYCLVVSVLIACYLLSAWLVNSKYGKVLTAIRDNEYRVLALGYDTAMYKTFVFALAGAMAGLAGALYTASVGTAGPDRFGIAFSIEIVIMVAVGGRGTLIGAMLGAFLVNLGNTYINNEFKTAWPIILGGLFVLVVGFMPEGIIGVLRKLPERLQRSRSPKLAAEKA